MPKPNPAVDDRDTIIVRVPMVFRRRGGRKALTAPDGSPAFAPAPASVDNKLIKALARAFRWRRLIEANVYTTVQEIAVAEKVNPSYVGRILRMTLFAPDIVEAVLNGRQKPEITLQALMAPFPIEWHLQRSILGAL